MKISSRILGMERQNNRTKNRLNIYYMISKKQEYTIKKITNFIVMTDNTSTTTADVTDEDFMNSIFILKDGLLNDLLDGRIDREEYAYKLGQLDEELKVIC